MRWNGRVRGERIEGRRSSRIGVWDSDHVNDEYLGL